MATPRVIPASYLADISLTGEAANYVQEYNNGKSSLFWVDDVLETEFTRSGTGFKKRFGIERLINRNNDMVDALFNPVNAVNKINGEYDRIAKQLDPMYRVRFNQLLKLGYSEEESKKATDAFMIPLIQNELAYLKLVYPYTFSGKDGVNPFDGIAKLGHSQKEMARIGEEDSEFIKNEAPKLGVNLARTSQALAIPNP